MLVFDITAAEGVAGSVEDDKVPKAEGVATSIDADSANDVAAAKCMAGYVDTTKVTGAAEDAGAGKAFARFCVPSSAEDFAVTAPEGVAASIDSVAVEIAEDAGSSKDFDRVLAPRPVSFFFGPIVSTQECHRYWSSSNQFTVLIEIVFHKEDHHIQNRITSISLQSIPVNDTYKTINQVKQEQKTTSKESMVAFVNNDV
eukprot:scaffold287891_cov54-Attheya_sp.AAC.1